MVGLGEEPQFSFLSAEYRIIENEILFKTLFLNKLILFWQVIYISMGRKEVS